MKKILTIFTLLIVTVVITGGVFGYFWWKNGLNAPSTKSEPKTVLITKGSSADAIAKKLKESGVIKDEFVFRLYVRINKLAGSLPVGEFQIPANLTVPQVIELIKKGPQELWVTLPEGLRKEELPGRFSSALNHTPAQAMAFFDSFLQASVGMEGYLFPDTYLVPKEISAERAVSLLKNTFDRKFPNSEKDVVILASILERETRGDAEKPVVAGIFQNRLRVGMPLQADATVQYAKASIACLLSSVTKASACPNWWPQVFLEDYKINNPFNTYVISGLPPAPIASAGLTSLQAAANPESSDYFYYIHDEAGSIHYARTLEEHNANVQKYLR